MKKRILALAIGVVLMLALTACGQTNDEATAATNAPTATTAPAATEAPTEKVEPTVVPTEAPVEEIVPTEAPVVEDVEEIVPTEAPVVEEPVVEEPVIEEAIEEEDIPEQPYYGDEGMVEPEYDEDEEYIPQEEPVLFPALKATKTTAKVVHVECERNEYGEQVVYIYYGDETVECHNLFLNDGNASTIAYVVEYPGGGYDSGYYDVSEMPDTLVQVGDAPVIETAEVTPDGKSVFQQFMEEAYSFDNADDAIQFYYSCAREFGEDGRMFYYKGVWFAHERCELYCNVTPDDKLENLREVPIFDATLIVDDETGEKFLFGLLNDDIGRVAPLDFVKEYGDPNQWAGTSDYGDDYYYITREYPGITYWPQ